MATVILVRHGRTSANASGVLAGRAKGVRLDDVGRDQVARAAGRISRVPVVAVVASPLERTRETATAIGQAQNPRLKPVSDRGLIECGYGEWEGRKLSTLAKDPLWTLVQQQPSAVTFPGGESIVGMYARAVDAVRRRDAEIAAAHGEHAIWAAVSHGDIIKAIVADAFGQSLDLFQRVVIDPGSITVIRYTAERPYVLQVNTHDGDLSWLDAPRDRKGRPRGAEVGGGAGPATARPASATRRRTPPAAP